MEKDKKTKVYSTTSCPYCILVKNFLKEKNIEFEEINLNDNPQAAQEMIAKTGQMGVPVIETPSGEIIIGFDQEELERIFG